MKKLRQSVNIWSWHIVWIVALIATPILLIFVNIFTGTSPNWNHLYRTVLGSYVTNTLWLALGAGVFSLVLGVSTAWLVSTCHFAGRRFFEWALILPLAIPTYINAYIYNGLMEYSGFIQQSLLKLGLISKPIDIMTLPGVVWVMALVLYPYVYVSSRAAFLTQSRNLLEASRILGKSNWQTFWQIALPVARPAIVGGVILVLMEVLNDYGAVKYYGVNTFTSGIFRSWFSLGDMRAAIYLSSLLMLGVFSLILLERKQRGKAQYAASNRSNRPLAKVKLSGKMSALAFVVCGFPVLFGFLLPLYQLLKWALLTYKDVLTVEFWIILKNSILLAGAASLLCVAVAVLLAYSVQNNRIKSLNQLSKVSILGYSIPGAVIAVGIMIPLLLLDKALINVFQQWFGVKIGLLLTGSVVALLFAYTVRYLAVAFNPIEANFQKIGKGLGDASRSLGKSSTFTLFNIHLPLAKSALIGAALMVFVDVLKELPLTLILRPFNFNTLATRAYQYASDEMVAESSIAALIIIFAGLVPIFVLNKLISR
jgi:iron(III) transport system permease protein